MNDLFTPRKKFAIAHSLRKVRTAFHDAMQEVRSDIIADVKDDNDIPKVREEFNSFAQVVADAVKAFDFCKKDNLVIAETKKGSVADVLRIAIEAYHKGHEDEAKKLFQYAAFNTTDMHLDNLPNSLITQNQCASCSSALPAIANFCPICGIRLQNQLTNNQSPLPVVQQQPMAPLPNVIPPTPPPQPIPHYPQFQTLPPMIMSAVKRLIEAGKSEEAMELILAAKDEKYISFDYEFDLEDKYTVNGFEGSGSNLDEILETGLFYGDNHHGGEMPDYTVGDLPSKLYDVLEKEITKQYHKKYGKD